MYIFRYYCVSPSLYPPRAAPGPRRKRGPARQAGTRHESVTGRGVAPADPRRGAVEPAGQPRPGGRARGWSGRRGVAGDRMSPSAFLLGAAARLHQPDIFRVGRVPVGSTPVAADLQLTPAAGCAAAARAGSSGGIRMAHAPRPLRPSGLAPLVDNPPPPGWSGYWRKPSHRRKAWFGFLLATAQGGG